MSERIEGVPVGTKLVRIGAKEGDYYIGYGAFGNVIGRWPNGSGNTLAAIVPDNVYGVIDLSSVPIRRATEWERVETASANGCFFEVDPDSDTYYLSELGDVCSAPQIRACSSGDRRRIHVRKIKPKTRRVLVGEWEIVADGGPKSHQVTEVHAQLLVEDHSNLMGLGRYRIEERPL